MTHVAALPDGRIPVLLSSHADDLLTQDAAALAQYLDTHPAQVGDVARHLLRTRRIRKHRAVLRARSVEELRAGLHAVASGADHSLVARSAAGLPPRVAFVFPGQGGQHPGMGADALRDFPAYRAAVDECAAAFAAAGHTTPLRYLTEDDAPESFSEIEIQGGQFTHAVGLAAIWRSLGVTADLVIGHSLGEIAAAHVAGAMHLADAVAVVAARAGVVDRLSGRYAVAALGLTADAAQALIEEIDGWLELSVINASAAVAVSGDADAVSEAVRRVHERGRLGREITVNFPVHTSVLEPLRDRVRADLPAAAFDETAVQFIGGTTGAVVAAGTGFVDYWYANLRNTVRFDRAVQTAIDCGASVFIELSTHPQLLHAIAEQAGESSVLVATGHRDHPLAEQVSAHVAAVAVADPTYRWREVLGADRSAFLRAFPNAAMRATSMWAQREPLEPASELTIGAQTWVPVGPAGPRSPQTVAVVPLGEPAPLVDHLRAVLPDVAPADAETLIAVAPADSATDPREAAATLVKLVQDGLLTHLDAVGPNCRRVWLVTTGAEQIGAADPAPSPVAAALAAVHRSVALERCEPAFGHLDIAPGVTAEAVLDAVLTGAGETALRVVDGQVRRYRREAAVFTGVAATDLDPAALRDVVITGGAGSVGLHFARQLAARGANRIVLLSRRAVDPAVCAEIGGPHGTEVVSVPCDITDGSQLSSAAAQFGGEGATLMVHCAGAARFGAAADLDPAAYIQTLNAKVIGAVSLAQTWPQRDDCRIVLCSSLSAVWGGRGHAAYAAANRMLDVVAQRLRADGRRCVSVRWGLWQGDGAGIVDTAETANIERSGLRPMPARQAVAAALRDYTVDPLVLAADQQRLGVFLAGLDGAVPAAAGAESPAAGTTADAVRTQLAAVLSLPDPEAVDLNASLFDLGVDSLLALDLRKRLKRVTGRTVGLARLLGGITGTELVSDLEEEVKPA